MTIAADGWRQETLAAIEAVQRALDLTAAGVRPEDISSKGPRDIVTAADLAAERAVRTHLSERLGVPVIGEEQGGDVPADGSPYWLLDPICGTRNFAHGIPLYCVNLGLVEDGEVTVAVVGDASRGELDLAERGHGAWSLRDGSRSRLAASHLSETVVIEEGRCTGPRRERAARYVSAAIRANRWELRALSTTLALPYVAAGRVAAYVLFSVSAVHAGAGSLLVTEAGGAVSDIDGGPWTVNSDSIVASATTDLHRELLDLDDQAGRVGS
jgi:myo-inositol-1(or 4)-monophosphatase